MSSKVFVGFYSILLVYLSSRSCKISALWPGAVRASECWTRTDCLAARKDGTDWNVWHFWTGPGTCMAPGGSNSHQFQHFWARNLFVSWQQLYFIALWDAFDFPSLAASRAAICIAQRWSMAVLNVQDDNYLMQAVEQLRKRTVWRSHLCNVEILRWTYNDCRYDSSIVGGCTVSLNDETLVKLYPFWNCLSCALCAVYNLTSLEDCSRAAQAPPNEQLRKFALGLGKPC